jgi:hypothetical protein
MFAAALMLTCVLLQGSGGHELAAPPLIAYSGELPAVAVPDVVEAQPLAIPEPIESIDFHMKPPSFSLNAWGTLGLDHPSMNPPPPSNDSARTVKSCYPDGGVRECYSVIWEGEPKQVGTTIGWCAKGGCGLEICDTRARFEDYSPSLGEMFELRDIDGTLLLCAKAEHGNPRTTHDWRLCASSTGCWIDLPCRLDIYTRPCVRQGNYAAYYPDGTRAAEGQYSGGKRSGVWVFFHRNGQIRARGAFKNDFPTGDWNWWFDNGARQASVDVAFAYGLSAWKLWFPTGEQDYCSDRLTKLRLYLGLRDLTRLCECLHEMRDRYSAFSASPQRDSLIGYIDEYLGRYEGLSKSEREELAKLWRLETPDILSTLEVDMTPNKPEFPVPVFEKRASIRTPANDALDTMGLPGKMRDPNHP